MARVFWHKRFDYRMQNRMFFRRFFYGGFRRFLLGEPLLQIRNRITD